MTQTLEPLYLYRDHLEGNEPRTLNYKDTDYTFQFFGPQRGNNGNWLEVTREDGVAKKFGAGHDPELIWRAFNHADKGWNQPQVPAYREETSDEEPWFQF